ncbi:hypothetical protein ACGFW5_26745 [Streptomyces sp. NPDC048416]|uniref:hypothetical protein n=1 Tax=Streptomyces sp. NPDC048416 TaxID=3365546 RepID=UPI0037186AB6
MGKNTKTAEAGVVEAQLDTARVRETTSTLRKGIALYGCVSAIVLATVAVMAVLGQSVTSFMWVRSLILLAVTALIHRMALDVATGSRRAYDRLSTLTVVLPIAIVGVDLVPGLCPPWFAVMQGLSALALVHAAVTIRGGALRTVFPKST